MKVLSRPQVLVVGGGPSGICAAIAAARNGAKVALVEQYGFPGGAATAALIGPWWGFHTALGEQIIRGIPQELVDRLIIRGGCLGHVPDIAVGSTSTMTPIDADLLQLVALEMISEVGIRLLLHTRVIDVITLGSECKGVIVHNREGHGAIVADVVIDATGDADIASAAGTEYEKGRPGDQLLQPMTLAFIVGGVDIEVLWRWLQKHPDQLELGRDPQTGIGKSGPSEYIASEVNDIEGFYDIMDRAIKRGEFPPYRDRICLLRTPRSGEWIVNATRIPKVDGTRTEDMVTAEIEGRRQASALARIMKRDIPGCENIYIARLPAQVGVRETRRIVGKYVLTSSDILSERKFEDGVAAGCFPIDIHQPDGNEATHIQMPRGGYYTIPYRSLIPIGIEQLIVVGRSISTDNKAFGSVRIQPTCMAVGQAGGTAAALCVRQNVPPTSLDIEKLRILLKQQDVIVD